MRAYVSRLKLHCFPTRRSSDLVMQAMSDTETPQGVLATLPLPDVRPPEDFAFALVSDAVSDPGNLGTIMRAAAAAAVPLLIVASGTRSEEHTSELQSRENLVCRLLLEKKNAT